MRTSPVPLLHALAAVSLMHCSIYSEILGYLNGSMVCFGCEGALGTFGIPPYLSHLRGSGTCLSFLGGRFKHLLSFRSS